MKTKVIMLSLALAAAGSVVAQENDDMYFNSKDRAKLNAQKTKEAPVATLNETRASEEETDVIPEQTYSSRNTNPEYSSRANSEVAQEDNEDYFVENYRYSNVEDFNNFNNRYNNWANNPWYTNSYYAPSMYAWNSPFYNSYMSPWGGSPFGGSGGWYGSFGYSWGSPYYGSYYGYGNSWAYYGGGWNNYYNWGNPNVIIVEGSGRGTVYGKRASRGGMVSNNNSANRTRSQIISNTDAGRRGNTSGRMSTATTSTSGRVATNGRSQDEYYNRGWRRSAEQNATTNTNSRSFTSPSPNSGRSNWGNSTNNTYTPTPSRSSSSNSGSFNPGSSGGSRSSGSSGSSSGGSSGGSRRGRD